MNTQVLSEAALRVIEAYKDVPYFNNKTTGRRAGLKVEIGKGSHKEIFEEVEHKAILQKRDLRSFNPKDLKKFMVENDIGIECSGFVYYVLNEESNSRRKGNLDKYLRFPFSSGIIGSIRAKLRPIENTDVKTFAHDLNSKVIQVKAVQAGDIITMVSNTERDHILVVYKIDFENAVPKTLHYTHAVAWPTDGEFGHGIHKGKIEIIDNGKSLVEQRWIELEKEGEENYTHMRAKKSVTELRRLNWFN